MKRIIRIGDSIRMNYDKFIRASLAKRDEGYDLDIFCNTLDISGGRAVLSAFERKNYTVCEIGS